MTAPSYRDAGHTKRAAHVRAALADWLATQPADLPVADLLARADSADEGFPFDVACQHLTGNDARPDGEYVTDDDLTAMAEVGMLLGLLIAGSGRA